jgi:hypothetical protein
MRRRSHSAYPEASGQKLALPRVPLRYRNLNLFPFRHGRLRHVLGPTYPRLTTHCRGTLAPSTEGILTPLWLLLPPGSATANGPLDLTAQLPPERRARLPTRLEPVSLGIGTWLSPVYFRRPQPRPVSCYALLGGWLLLSLPSSCLRLRTAFNFYT